MTHQRRCPHCGERTEVEEPAKTFDGEDQVEHQQDCTYCGRSIVAVFRVRYELREVVRA